MLYLANAKDGVLRNNMIGINLIGFFSATNGLGITARAMAELMTAQKIKFCIINVALPNMGMAPKEDYEKFAQFFSNKPLYPINLFVFGADLAKHVYPKIKNVLEVDIKYNVLIPFWELYEYPDDFIALKNDFHMFLAPTRFIQYSLMRVIDHSLIEYIPPGLILDKDEITSGVKKSSDKFTFFFNFDINSSIVRKNPEALINAFIDTFSDDASVELILKVNGLNNPIAKKIVTQLDNISNRRNIRLIYTFLPYKEMLELIASSDCYISCHRSEGLGNGLFEAMSLGVPCIATGYGGNTEFMNHRNSILLRYKLEAVQCQHYQAMTKKRDTWACVDQQDLINAMVRIRTDDLLREKIIKNAKQDIDSAMLAFWSTTAFQSIFESYSSYVKFN